MRGRPGIVHAITAAIVAAGGNITELQQFSSPDSGQFFTRIGVQGSDAAWFISRGVIAEELASGAMRTVATGSATLTGAVGITRKGPGNALLDLVAELAREAARDGL